MQKWMPLLLVLIGTTAVYGQKKTVVIRVKQNYAVINKGVNAGVKEGDRFRLYTPGNRNQYGEVEVIKALPSISAVRLLRATPGYRLKVGDIGEVSESSIVDELLHSVPYDHGEPMGNASQQVQRKGFIIGGGVGAGYLQNQYSGLLFGAIYRVPLLTDFKIGYAPCNRLEVYYVNKVFWWGENGVTVILGLSSLGFTWYTNEQTATGFFMSGGGGISTADAPFENIAPSYGYGFFAGLGYEFSKHWSIEADLLYSRVTDSGIAVDSFGVRATINLLAY